MMKRSTPFLTLLFALAFALPAGISKAGIIDSYRYELEIFTSNGNYYNDPGVDLYVEVSLQEEAGQPDRLRFEFHNDSTMYCSLADIYFDDGSLSELVSIDHGPGTAFSQWANPSNLPGGNTLVPPFQTSLGFSADSDSPPPHNGVEASQAPEQWVAIIFNLEAGADLDSVLNDLDTAELRIGVHTIGFPGAVPGAEGSSESAVTVPEPTTLVLLAMTAGIALFYRRPTQ